MTRGGANLAIVKEPLKIFWTRRSSDGANGEYNLSFMYTATALRPH